RDGFFIPTPVISSHSTPSHSADNPAPPPCPADLPPIGSSPTRWSYYLSPTRSRRSSPMPPVPHGPAPAPDSIDSSSNPPAAGPGLPDKALLLPGAPAIAAPRQYAPMLS